MNGLPNVVQLELYLLFLPNDPKIRGWKRKRRDLYISTSQDENFLSTNCNEENQRSILVTSWQSHGRFKTIKGYHHLTNIFLEVEVTKKPSK